MLLCSFFIPTLSVHVQQQPRPALLLLPSNRGTEDPMIKQKKKKGPWTLMILKTSAGIFVMATYPRLKSMKLYATFPLSLLLCFLIFSLVMAEEDQRKEIPQEQSLPSIEQQSVTIRVAENLVSDGVDATIDRNFLGLNLPAARREWPDVVGMSVEEAEKRIKEDMPMAIFQVVLPNCFVTMDYNLRRVRLYVDSSAKVVRPPKTG